MANVTLYECLRPMIDRAHGWYIIWVETNLFHRKMCCITVVFFGGSTRTQLYYVFTAESCFKISHQLVKLRTKNTGVVFVFVCSWSVLVTSMSHVRKQWRMSLVYLSRCKLTSSYHNMFAKTLKYFFLHFMIIKTSMSCSCDSGSNKWVQESFDWVMTTTKRIRL